MSERVINVCCSHDTLVEAFNGVTSYSYCIASYELDGKGPDRSKMSNDELEMWCRGLRNWKVAVRHNNAEVLNENKLYTSLWVIEHELQNKVAV